MLPLLSLLATTALALPATIPTSPLQPRDTQTWTIPTLNLHFMTENDGLPGGGWPASQPHFNSALDFVVDMPSGNNTTAQAICHASFPNGTLPTATFPCAGDDQVSFTMTPYDGPGAGARPELSFVLTVLSTLGLTGSTPVTDDFSWSSANPLECYNGAPLDGMRCHINFNYTLAASSN